MMDFTKEHKDMILEMAKALFPGWDRQFFGIQANLDDNFFYQEDYSKREACRGTHWFQFCIVDLGKELIQDFEQYDELILSILTEYEHPVELLYSKFKNLQQ